MSKSSGSKSSFYSSSGARYFLDYTLSESRKHSSDLLKQKRRSSRDHTAVEASAASASAASSTSTALPDNAKAKLHSLFKELECEFESLYLENVQLREKISALEKSAEVDGEERDPNKSQHPVEESLKMFTKNKAYKTRNRLKVQTSRIVSSFKPPSVTCSLVKEYKGHRDGIWDIDVSNLGNPIIGTASADKTAKIWGIDSAKCLLSYVGHAGSVNSICFHPAQDLVLTASGDGTTHVWKATAAASESLCGVGGGAAGAAAVGASSEDSAESSEDENNVLSGGVTGAAGADGAKANRLVATVRNPISVLSGHQGVVISCQWLADEQQAVTAGWDRLANLYDVSTGTLLQQLAGHDGELTHVACHPTQRLVATCSVDSTFRLWDFREAIHSVSVFQGHTESVSCAAFGANSDQIISGSDDRSVKVWDLRNMRAPETSIQTTSPVNRLAVSQTGIIAIPQDNRNVVLYDLSGQKLSRLPRDSTKSHHRMVSSTCWSSGDSADGWRSRANLFSAGFDRLAFGWSVRTNREKDADVKTAKERTKESTM